ncbi:hypothetical protein CAOG_01626 [Capsaspora owczarzaki ATCC 30864]|uniref:Bifunctional lysine-specific demethylase and histidyl-hydroxylase n=1 Tax=Capsaspora owczarzaki (strain ATCC 30864) TaxID=595528 RepID=A0A0D2WKT1_CAPO3|nr:hypothetical protein CAOG_01626 [Capsaspora owczarzaki ATCC 30864]KJE90293.1 hypothetical protein CAOG_001626 [Capsaspora owczarzaki ATCC 30864]|eukprot:XP_004364494.1 hypothetical protein CAOG_01626 [Capsaspora owczarzaki ATCC 30864]
MTTLTEMTITRSHPSRRQQSGSRAAQSHRQSLRTRSAVSRAVAIACTTLMLLACTTSSCSGSTVSSASRSSDAEWQAMLTAAGLPVDLPRPTPPPPPGTACGCSVPSQPQQEDGSGDGQQSSASCAAAASSGFSNYNTHHYHDCNSHSLDQDYHWSEFPTALTYTATDDQARGGWRVAQDQDQDPSQDQFQDQLQSADSSNSRSDAIALAHAYKKGQIAVERVPFVDDSTQRQSSPDSNPPRASQIARKPRPHRFAPPNDRHKVLQKLFGAHGAKVFATVFERQFLHIRHHRAASQPELDLRRLIHPDDLVAITRVYKLVINHEFLVIKNEKAVYPVDRPATNTALLVAVHDGATVILISAHNFHAPLMRLVADVEQTLGVFSDVSATFTGPVDYFSRPRSPMFDLILVQTFGSQIWRVCEPIFPLPNDKYDGNFMPSEALQHCVDAHLQAGDVLYIPRGTIISSRATDEASLHVTISLHSHDAFTWHTVLETSLRALVSANPQFEEPIYIPRFEFPPMDTFVPFLSRPKLSQHPAVGLLQLLENSGWSRSQQFERPMRIGSGMLLNLLLRLVSIAPDDTSTRQTFPAWLLVDRANLEPTATNLKAITEHIEFLIVHLLDVLETRLHFVQYYMTLSPARHRVLQERSRARGPEPSRKQQASDELLNQAVRDWDAAVYRSLLQETMSEEDLENVRHITSRLRELLRPALAQDKLATIVNHAIENVRQDQLAGLLAQPFNFTSLARIPDLTLNARLQRPARMLAGTIPLNFEDGETDLPATPLFACNRVRVNVDVDAARIIALVLKARGPFSVGNVAVLASQLAFDQDDVDEFWTQEGKEGGGDVEAAPDAQASLELLSLKERERVETLALTIAKDLVSNGCLQIAQTELYRERVLGWELPNELSSFLKM